MMTTRACSSVLAAACLAVLALSTVNAQVRVTESFSTPLGGVPEGWSAQLLNRNNRADVVTIAPTEGIHPVPALRIEREGAVPESGAAYFTGSEGTLRDGRMADLTASVLLRFSETKNGQNLRGLVVRAKHLSYAKSEGYFIAVVPRGTERSLNIYYNPQSHVDSGTLLASVPLEGNLEANSDYLLRVKAQGPVIEASLASVGRDSTVTELASVSTDKATESTSGLIGVRAAYANSGPLRTWFRQLHFTDIGGK